MKLSHRTASRDSVLFVVVALVLSSASCNNSTNDTQLAQDGVSQFHLQLDSAQYHAIYAGADEKLHQVSGEVEFTALLQAIHLKLGKIQDAKLQSTQVGWYTGQGKVVTLVYATQFEGGNSQEKFTWHISNGRPWLEGYYINSNALITK
jgi:hypothetical protein